MLNVVVLLQERIIFKINCGAIEFNLMLEIKITLIPLKLTKLKSSALRGQFKSLRSFRSKYTPTCNSLQLFDHRVNFCGSTGDHGSPNGKYILKLILHRGLIK